MLHGQVPAAVKTLKPVGRLPGTNHLDFSIGLPLRNREALTNLLRQLYDPASPGYRQFLTPEQFTARFGPTEEDYQAVVRFAETQGFRVTAKHKNRTLVSVQATVADIEKALHLRMQRYQHPTEARTFRAPDAEPSVDLDVGVLALSGLDDYALARPCSFPSAGSANNGAYLGKELRAAYAPGVTRTGAGQTVGLLQFDGYYPADIAAYEKLNGLPNVMLTNVLVDGFDGSAGANNNEVALDIEMALAMAPGLARIVVYEEPNPGIPNNVLNRMATDNLAKQLSSSWGNFAVDANTEQIFLQFAAQGQSFFQASGDSGAHVGAVTPPMDNPNITIVGGTTLSTSGAGGPWAAETVWNWYSTGVGAHGSGGGISTCYPLPSWQQGISMAANQGSATYRNVPDVAMVADNVWAIYNNGTGGAMAGTSVAAPLWAGFMALVNEQAAAYGNPPVGFLNPALYALGKGPACSAVFHDITSGNNTSSSSPDKFFAAAGYDLCTGWGTPAGTNLINALAPRSLFAPAGLALVAEGCAPPDGVVDPNEVVTVNLALQNLSPASTSNLVAVLQAGNGVVAPSGAQLYGVLTRDGPAVSRPFSFLAAGACGDSITASLELQENGMRLGTVSFTLPLGNQVRTTYFAENFDATAVPLLPAGWTAPVEGGGAGWIVSAARNQTASNAAFADEPALPGVSDLLSPPMTIGSSAAQLSFQSSYDAEADPADASLGYDGGVLELKVGNGSFTDILAAGGRFAAGGYTRTLYPSGDNPLAGRRAWSGRTSGFTTTIVDLPSGVAGQTVQFRWRFGTDTGNGYGGSGWFIDSICIQEIHSDCCSPVSSLAVAQSRNTAYVAFPTVAGRSYTVEYKNSLADGQWLPIFSNVAGTGGVISLSDSTAAGGSRFYRVTGN